MNSQTKYKLKLEAQLSSNIVSYVMSSAKRMANYAWRPLITSSEWLQMSEITVHLPLEKVDRSETYNSELFGADGFQ